MSHFAVVLIVSVTVTFTLASLLTMRYMGRRARNMIRERKREDAVVSEECMIREGFRECPGLAQVADGTLFIDSAFFNLHYAIPLSDITLTKEVGGIWRFTGRNGWIGRWRFHLKTPRTSNLVIGVRNPDAWRTIFSR